MNKTKIQQGIRLVLEGLAGPEWKEDPNYKDTPRRVADFYEEMFSQQSYEPTTFPAKYRQMIVLAHHKQWAMCPHHLLPFELDISVAYIPAGNGESEVLGLSKLVRLIQNHFEEPILQEDLTDSVADEVLRVLTKNPVSAPQGVGVLIEGAHTCMQARGVKTAAYVVTEALRGVFLKKPEVRLEFFELIRRK